MGFTRRVSLSRLGPLKVSSSRCLREFLLASITFGLFIREIAKLRKSCFVYKAQLLLVKSTLQGKFTGKIHVGMHQRCVPLEFNTKDLHYVLIPSYLGNCD